MNQYNTLKYFTYTHLPEYLQVISKPFHDLAYTIASLEGDEIEIEKSLDKLLEAKDAAVRASVKPKQ